jgi:DNA repair photolyase
MIISASRRTDIPAFYADWFANRLRAGFLMTRNPFNAHQVKRVSLARRDVEAIIFWTRNANPLLPHLPLLDGMGHAYYFQYTITGYPRALEKSVPRPQTAVDTFRRLADLIGPERMVWRYDPILLSNLVGTDEHKRLFEKIAGLLQGSTRRVTISFADFYRKTERNLKAVEGLRTEDALDDRAALSDLAAFMARVAAENGLEIQTCSERLDLAELGIGHGKCVDDGLLHRAFGIKADGAKDKGQREECGCVKSVDIGAYNTCLHGCAYCYATFNGGLAARNHAAHDQESPFLVGAPYGA